MYIMNLSDSSHVEMLSDNDDSEDYWIDSNESYDSADYSSHFVEPSLASIEEFGPEMSQPIPNEDRFAMDKLAWVPTFQERVGESISRLLKPMKFCTSGKMNAPPVIGISLLKVQKCISFPLHEDMLDSIIPALEQSAFGRGTETIVDTSVRNSWELNHTDFEIMNSEWNSHLMDVLIPMIQHDLRLEVGFRLSLYKFLLYKTGSFFKPHRDTEKEDGMFGTVVIQLPSLYDGGKLIVRHNHRSEEVDLCSGTTPQNGFSTFYTAFYCDCEHEILPVANGVRACLVYNLVMTGKIQKTIPSAARLEVESLEADSVDLLRNYWPNDQKVVYCLSHKYSQKNLSLDNLKSTDRVVAQFFQKYADSCSLDVQIGILKRKTLYDSDDIHYDDHSDYDGHCDYDNSGYEIRHIKPLYKDHHNCLPSMKVDFRREVFPENSFHDIKAFDSKEEYTGNEGYQEWLFYQCAAIMIFRHDDLVPILLRDDAKGRNFKELFLNEFEKIKQNLSDENEKIKFLRWARVMMDRLSNMSIYDNDYEHKYFLATRPEMFETLLLLDNVELLQKYLQILDFIRGDFSYVYKMCHRHGWATFARDIISKFDTVRAYRIETVQKFIDYKDEVTQNDADKQSIIDRILKDEDEE